MFEFFEECEFTGEQLSDSRKSKIKASVLSRIKEDKPMKKITVLRSIMLAATAAAVGTLSLIGSADSVPTADTNYTKHNGAENVKITYVTANGSVDSESLVRYEIYNVIDTDGAVSETETVLPDEGQILSCKKLIHEAEGESFEINGMTVKIIAEKGSDMELVGVDDDGTRHYTSRYGGTASVWTADGVEGDIQDDEDFGSYLYVRVD